MKPDLDIVIPVYNEGRNILATIGALRTNVKTPFRVLICYDMPDDDTVSTIRTHPQECDGVRIEFVRNAGRGPHRAVLTGFAASTAPYVVVLPADDDYNAVALDKMVATAKSGCEIVCASRFMPGGSGLLGCPKHKAALVQLANFTLHHVARLPTHDATNGFRLFTRRVIEGIAVESERGFCYSIELLVKCHRLGWRIAEVPVHWFERAHGQSRFRLIGWLPAYLRWYFYAFATTYLRRSANTVRMKQDASADPSMVRP